MSNEQKGNKKSIFFSKDFDKTAKNIENTIKLTSLIIPSIIILMNLFYSSNAELYYNIPKKYFNINITDYIIILLPIIFLHIIIIAPIYLKKYFIKIDDSRFFRFRISFLYSFIYITIVAKGLVYLYSFFELENLYLYFFPIIFFVFLLSLYIFYMVFSGGERENNLRKVIKDRNKIISLIKNTQRNLSYLEKKNDKKNYDKMSKLLLIELKKSLTKEIRFLDEKKQKGNSQINPDKEKYSLWDDKFNLYKDKVSNIDTHDRLKKETNNLIELLDNVEYSEECSELETKKINKKSVVYNFFSKDNRQLIAASVFVFTYVITLLSYGLNLTEFQPITKRNFEVMQTKIDDLNEDVAIISEYKGKYVVQKYNIEDDKFYLITKNYFLIDVGENQLEYVKKDDYKGNVEFKKNDDISR